MSLLRTKDVEVELGVQLNVFEESKEMDEEQMIQSEEMMSLSHHQLFHTLFEKVKCMVYCASILNGCLIVSSVFERECCNVQMPSTLWIRVNFLLTTCANICRART